MLLGRFTITCGRCGFATTTLDECLCVGRLLTATPLLRLGFLTTTLLVVCCALILLQLEQNYFEEQIKRLQKEE